MTKSNEQPEAAMPDMESDVDRFLRETHELANEISNIHPRLYALLEKANEIQTGCSHGCPASLAFFLSSRRKGSLTTKSIKAPGTDMQHTQSDVDRFVRKAHELGNEMLSISPRLRTLLRKASEIQDAHG